MSCIRTNSIWTCLRHPLHRRKPNIAFSGNLYGQYLTRDALVPFFRPPCPPKSMLAHKQEPYFSGFVSGQIFMNINIEFWGERGGPKESLVKYWPWLAVCELVGFIFLWLRSLTELTNLSRASSTCMPRKWKPCLQGCMQPCVAGLAISAYNNYA